MHCPHSVDATVDRGHDGTCDPGRAVALAVTCVTGRPLTLLSSIAGLGRFLSHSKLHANLVPKVEPDTTGHPRVLFRAARDIAAEEELMFDYGDRSAEAIADFAWLTR
jgi:hypothetical protein